MIISLRLGQDLQEKFGSIYDHEEIHDTVWFTKLKPGHDFRVENEWNTLRRFQGYTPHLQPLLDEIATIVLRYLEDYLLNASKKRALNRKELKFVSKGVLEALNVLHENGYVHTDFKPHNVLVNYRDDDIRFADVEPGDCGALIILTLNMPKVGLQEIVLQRKNYYGDARFRE